MNQSILNSYQQRVDQAQQQIDNYTQLINSYSLYRLIIFALVIVAIYLSVKTAGLALLLILCLLLLVGFAWLVSRQSYFEQQRNYFIALKAVNQNEVDSITHRLNMYDNGNAFADEKHHYTADLDIFGNASLFQLINRAATLPGKQLLAGWLAAPADQATIIDRQEAVKEIANHTDWKLDNQARLLFANKADAGRLNNLFAYLRTSLHLPGERWLKPYISLTPFLLLGAIAAGQFFPLMNLAATAIAIFNMGLLMAKSSYMEKSGLIADKIGQLLDNYAVVFKEMEGAAWQSAGCKKLSQQLNNGHTSQKIAELAILINKLNYSLIMIVGFVLNVFFLWSLKQVIAIEKWKRNNQENLETAFDVIAGFEALISLSSLAINYPNWCFPEIVIDKGYTYMGKNLAHPLIGEQNRIANDFELNDAHKIDIITGSNMAGKSTFLRTVGINAVLGLCGAPVCADRMRLSVIRIITYMRIKDSLNESTSTFKGELDRLQMLLAAVEQGEKVYFLIDEMLRGTNSVDKYLGSKAVIKQLIHKNGVGQVATHDLQIARLEDEHPQYIHNFYFDIQVHNGEMLFDYKIKQGECKTFNASLLLRQIGVDVQPE